MNEQPMGPAPDPKTTQTLARAIGNTASALSDVASTTATGSLGKWGPIANLSAVALIGVMLWFSQRDAAKMARDDRTQHGVDLKMVVDVVREHQASNREENNRNSDRVTKSVDDLAREIRSSRQSFERAIKEEVGK